ncbi:hypothetical protein GQ473_06205 [archaeon]|nr:hypothetical protein [archaeon]
MAQYGEGNFGTSTEQPSARPDLYEIIEKYSAIDKVIELKGDPCSKENREKIHQMLDEMDETDKLMKQNPNYWRALHDFQRELSEVTPEQAYRPFTI